MRSVPSEGPTESQLWRPILPDILLEQSVAHRPYRIPATAALSPLSTRKPTLTNGVVRPNEVGWKSSHRPQFFDSRFDCSEDRRVDFKRVQRRQGEIGYLVSSWWLVKVQASVVRIWMAIPATLPPSPVERFFDVVHGEITGCEPPDIESGSGDRLRILACVEYCTEESRFVAVRIERGFGDQRIRRTWPCSIEAITRLTTNGWPQ